MNVIKHSKSNVLNTDITQRIEPPYRAHLDTADLTTKSINGPELAENQSLLNKIILLTKLEWNRLRLGNQHFSRASVDQLKQLFTKPSAKLLILEANYNRTALDPVPIGCLFMLTNQTDFHDPELIPWDYLKNEVWCKPEYNHQQVYRGAWAVVSKEAHRLAPRGKALDLLTSELKKITPAYTPIITRIVVGPENLAFRWSSNAFQARGFAPTGQKVVIPDELNDGQKVQLTYEWFIYPPLNNEGIANVAAFRSKFNELQLWEQRRIAPAAAHFSSKTGQVLVVGFNASQDAQTLAAILPQSLVYELPTEAVPAKTTFAHLKNLRPLDGLKDFSSVPENNSAVFLSGALASVTHAAQTDLLINCIKNLNTGGYLSLHDHVRPEGSSQIVTMVLDNTNTTNKTPSTAECFSRYVQILAGQSNVAGTFIANQDFEIDTSNPNNTIIRLRLGDAWDFALKKDYFADWPNECRKPYLSHSEADYLNMAYTQGLRILATVNEQNPWIIANRLKDKLQLLDQTLKPLAYPATGFSLVAEKVANDQGVGFEITHIHDQTKQAGFLTARTYKNKLTNRTWEIVERNNETLDIVPYSVVNGQYYLFVRSSSPRPLITLLKDPLDQVKSYGYMREQISAILPLSKITDPAQLDQVTAQVLADRLNLPKSAIQKYHAATAGFVSPGASDEYVTQRLVQVDLGLDNLTFNPKKNDFSSAGKIQAIEARQLLYAAHLGHQPDGRVERKVYELMLENKLYPGPWIGEIINLTTQESKLYLVTTQEFINPSQTQRFELLPNRTLQFLNKSLATVNEVSATGEVLHTTELEFVAVNQTTGKTNHTTAILPIIKTADDLLVGFETRHLPSLQKKTGSSALNCFPAFRTFENTTTLPQACVEVAERLKQNFAINTLQVVPIGAGYFPLSGTSMEKVYPVLAEVDVSKSDLSTLTWISLNDLLPVLQQCPDAHSQTLGFRAAHALGLLGGEV